MFLEKNNWKHYNKLGQKLYILFTLLDIDKLFSYKAFTIHTPSKEIY